MPIRWIALCLLSLQSAADNSSFILGVFLRPDAGNLRNLHEYAEAVSHPRSFNYGAYLSQSELVDKIGIQSSAPDLVSKWLKSSLTSLSLFDASRTGNFESSRPDLKVSQNTHRDAVTAVTSDWQPMFLLGLALSIKSGSNASREAGISNATLDFVRTINTSVFLPPDFVELIVVPGAPDGYCHSFTDAGRRSCEVSGPCFWNVSTVSSNEGNNSETNASNYSFANAGKANNSGRCIGDSGGLICWSEAKHARIVWHCFDPLLADSNAITKSSGGDIPSARKELWKRRRRGARRQVGEATILGNSSNEQSGSWIASSLSKAMVLIYQPPRAGMSWVGFEISYKQLGMRHSLSLHLEDFTLSSHTGHYLYRVAGLENFYPVSDIVVCMQEDRINATVAHGCSCNLTIRKDSLGRDCEQIHGRLPELEPVSLIFPYPLQSLAALQHDMGIVPTSVASAHLATQAVAEFAYQAFGEKDIPDICKSFGVDASKLNISVHGPTFGPGASHNLTFDNSGEGGLDMQIVTAMAPGSPTVWLGIDPYNLDGFVLALAVQLNEDPTPPLVISISWGDVEAAYPSSFVKRLDYELMKLVLRGLTVLVASGDNGISATSPKCEFMADIIGSSPWVTSVGATMTSMEAKPYCHDQRFASNGICEERGQIVASTTAGSSITSSGYWSSQRTRPSYQADSVRRYLSLSNLSRDARRLNLSTRCCLIDDCECSLASFIDSGRGSPDVAAPGHSFAEVIDGEVGLVDGTSASAPVLAAVISLLNAEQLQRGEPALGFLNPWLYSLYESAPHSFVDVTVGDIASTEAFVCPVGFPAKPGWDAATGLGIPQLSQLLQNLPRRQRKSEVSASQASQSDSMSSVGQLMDSSELQKVGARFWAIFLCIGLVSISGYLYWRLSTVPCQSRDARQQPLLRCSDVDTHFLHM